MAKTYETTVHAAGFIHGYISSQGFKSKKALTPTERFQAKKLQSALEQIPEHAIDKNGQHFFGADLEKPIEGTAHSYFLKTNAEGEPIVNCRVKIPEAIVSGLLWEHVFKALLEDKIPQELAERLEVWLKDFGLQETFEKWLESVVEDETEKEPAPEPQPVEA